MLRKTEKTRNHGRLLKHGRYLHGAALGTLGFCTSWAVDHTGQGREWIEVEQLDLRLRNLPDRLRGRRIVHISDLHLSRIVSMKYLRRCVDRVNELDADIVVLTGDYITHDRSGEYRQKAVKLIGDIKSHYGTYACLGNHDYGMMHSTHPGRDGPLEDLVEGMTENGVRLLRNESAAVQIDGRCLWLVGLGDLWVGDFKPDKAFADVPAKEAVIALSHNPRGIDRLGAYPVEAVMSGHTHGARQSWSLSGGLTRSFRRFHAGMYDVGGTKLYVNRGLGRLGRARLNARPEITVLTLR